MVFLTLYTFVVLVKMYPVPRWQEVYVTVVIITAGIEKCREIMISEPVSLRLADVRNASGVDEKRMCVVYRSVEILWGTLID